MNKAEGNNSARSLIDDARNKIRSGMLGEAEGLLDRVIQSGDCAAEALYWLASISFKREQYKTAANIYLKSLAVDPKHFPAHMDYAACLIHLRQPQQALVHADIALSLEQNSPRSHNTRGAALLHLGRPQEALAAFIRSLELKPDFVQAMVNLGAYYRVTNQNESAIAWYSRALAIDPSNVEANFSRSLIYLRLGRYSEGFAAYEWRFRRNDMSAGLRTHENPRWVGQLNVRTGTVLLQEEQGLGDTIQFCRYALLLAAQGTKVILEVRPALRALFSCFEDRMTVIEAGEPLPSFDCHSPLLSLPFACGTTIGNVPAAARYLAAPGDRVAKWTARLGVLARPRIGIVWRGQPSHTNDLLRSIPLNRFPIPEPSFFDVYSLQHVVNSDDQAILDALPITQLGPQFADMADTAAVLEMMDLIITVDTSVAHLAAALGRPTWVLLSLDSDWRWLEGREDSPWYPTVRLFRQTIFNDWTDVVSNVAAALRRTFGDHLPKLEAQ